MSSQSQHQPHHQHQSPLGQPASQQLQPPVSSGSSEPSVGSSGGTLTQRATASHVATAQSSLPPVAKQRTTKARPTGGARGWVQQHQSSILVAGGVTVAAALVSLSLWLFRRGKGSGRSSSAVGPDGKPLPGPCANLRPTASCVPLADGSAVIIRRTIPADNSCLFNAVGYCMNGSKSMARMLRSEVAREVASDPTYYSDVFLGMSNAAYCSWITQPYNWGGGIELAILARHYAREISAWNIESCKQHVFGEESGYTKRVMLIYTGTHYDALAIAKNPRAPESDDKTEFNPRTKTGKMAIAAAAKLVELTHNKTLGKKKSKTAGAKLRCNDCHVILTASEAAAHAKKTGHANFEQVAVSK